MWLTFHFFGWMNGWVMDVLTCGWKFCLDMFCSIFEFIYILCNVLGMRVPWILSCFYVLSLLEETCSRSVASSTRSFLFEFSGILSVLSKISMFSKTCGGVHKSRLKIPTKFCCFQCFEHLFLLMTSYQISLLIFLNLFWLSAH